eukprot:1351855-Rhodomonas_salina.2
MGAHKSLSADADAGVSAARTPCRHPLPCRASPCCDSFLSAPAGAHLTRDSARAWCRGWQDFCDVLPGPKLSAACKYAGGQPDRGAGLQHEGAGHAGPEGL